MTNVVRFRFKDGSRVAFNVKRKKGSKHKISVAIIDLIGAEDTRVLVQRRISRAASFRALLGFNDNKARSGGVHIFSASRQLTARFVKEIFPLVNMGLVQVRIDGMPLRKVRVA